MPQPATSSTPEILVLKKAAAILAVFSFQSRNLSLTAIANATALPKTTVHRVLQTLQQLGWVVLKTDQTYMLGPGLLELGGIARASLDWREILTPHLNRLSAKVRHTVLVATLTDDRLLYVDKRDSQYMLQVTSHIGQRRVPHFGATGKAIMAYLPKSEVERLLDKYPLEPLTTSAMVDVKAFRERLAAIRKVGYATEVNEILDGTFGVAAPIFADSPRPIAVVGIAAPMALVGPEGLDAIAAEVVTTAKEVSLELGAKIWPPVIGEV